MVKGSRLLGLNEDCLTLVLKFLKLQDLLHFDVCATGDKALSIAGSSYLTSLQHLEHVNLIDGQRVCHISWSPKCVLWAGRKDLRCLLSSTRIRLGNYVHRFEEGVEEETEEEKGKQNHLRVCMDKALGVIGTKCTIASEIGLQGPAISDLGVAALLAAKGSSISTLRIEFCHGITDAAMAAISEHLGDSLVDLAIRDCPVSDVGLIQVISGCPKLNSLSLQFDRFIHEHPASVTRFPAPAYHITEATLFAIAENLPELDSLSCDCWGFYRLNSNSFIRVDAFVAIVEACNLSTLSVEHVIADDSILIALGENCCNLYELSLRTGNGSVVTNVGITALAEGCPDMVHLYLTGASGITDAGMAAVGKHCLNLESFCPPSNISDTGLEIVLKSCKALDTIILKSCSALTVASARTLAAHGASLIDLRLMVCQWLDDASLFTIATACKHLASLEIFSTALSSQITNEGLLAVARACEKLGYVYVRGTLVTQEGIDALKRTLPGVNVRLVGR